MSDGTVMAENNPNTSSTSSFGYVWYRLTPDANGHYVNGIWSDVAPMNDTRLFHATQVLRDGRLFVAGGEYGTGIAKAEVFDPQANGGFGSWTPINPPTTLLDPAKNQKFVDCESKMLADGSVLLAPVNPSVAKADLRYNPVTNGWSQGPTNLNKQSEVSWVKLPDGSILTIDPFNGYLGEPGTNSERYIPALGTWILDANLPVNLWVDLSAAGLVGEIGAGLLLPNGKAFYLGGSGHTAIYTPSGSTTPGNWVAGPDIPNGLSAADAPAVMMPNGKILCAVAGPPFVDSNTNVNFPKPTSFFEYDYSLGSTGQFTQVSGPTGSTDNTPPFETAFLALPDGSILYCNSMERDFPYNDAPLYVYVPDGPQVTLGKQPAITSIAPNGDGSFHLTGTGLNGISEGAAYGDNKQMDSNYPLIMFMDTNNGHIDYGRTYNWSSSGVQSGSTIETTDFTLPPGLNPQTYLVAISASGVTSAPVTFSFVTPSSLSLCPGDNGALSVIASPQPASYQWLFNGQPLSGQTSPQLNFVSATTNQSGLYSLRVTSANGTFTSLPSQVSVGVWAIQLPPDTTTATLCQPETLSLTAQGKGQLAIQWFRNGYLVVPDSRITTIAVPQAGGGTTFSLNFSDIQYRDDGVYTAFISDNCGSVTVGYFSLRVTPNPPWLLVANQGPPPRYYASMAYDSDRHVTVLFGGNNASSIQFNDTWEFDGTNWAQRFPAISPPARALAQLAYDSLRHRCVLFGGQTYANSQLQITKDTWEWDGTNWVNIPTPHVPGWDQPWWFAGCYDSARGETLVFSGLDSSLWGYDGTDWRLKSPAGGPPVDSHPLMTFDSFRNVAVLLGGNSQSNYTPYASAAVWEWNGSAWKERTQSGQGYGGANSSAMAAFDTFRGESVVYGYVSGTVDGTNINNLPYPYGYRFIWRWNGRQWQADLPTSTPGAILQQYGSMCFDTWRNTIVEFGGVYTSVNPNYTYELTCLSSPAVLSQPLIQYFLPGEQVQLSVVVAGAPTINYQWQKETVNLTDSAHLSGSTNNILAINAAVPADAGNYLLVASNLCGLTFTQPITLVPSAGTIKIARSGGLLVFTWSNTGVMLQTASSLLGPWTTISGATSPYIISTSASETFFRLAVP